LIPLRHQVVNADVALALVVVVVAVAATGTRLAALVAAVSASVAFDVLHTEPYGSLTIRRNADVVTAALLLGVGIIVGELAVHSRRHQSAAVESGGDLARIHTVAEMVAAGESADFVIMAVAAQLEELLCLRDVRFERSVPDDHRPHIEPNGELIWGTISWGVKTMGLPGKDVELAVRGQGRSLGRFLLTSRIGSHLSPGRLVVAVALADQAGAALCAQGAAA